MPLDKDVVSRPVVLDIVVVADVVFASLCAVDSAVDSIVVNTTGDVGEV